MRSLFVRFLIIGALGWGMWVLFQRTHASQATGVDADQLVIGYISIVALGAVMAGMIGVSIIPMIGDMIGDLFYNAPEQVERNPHAAALAKVNAGDFTGAIEAYHVVLKANSADTLAISEVVRLTCEKLHDPESAATFLEEKVGSGVWTNDQLAFLSERLVDIYWHYMQDAYRARAILIQLAEQLPDTRHSANALHRLQEIDRTLG